MQNKCALTRYHIIDEAMNNSMSKYPSLKKFQELIYEKTGLDVCISSIQKDLYAMRNDDALGFHAPIQYSHFKSGYYYTDSEFTINIKTLLQRIQILKQNKKS